jgi:hypothetical protein
VLEFPEELEPSFSLLPSVELHGSGSGPDSPYVGLRLYG